MATPLQVLILEDRQSDVELILYELRQAGFEPHWTRVDTEHDFLVQLQASPDVILSDYTLPSFDGMSALRLTRQSGLSIPFIIVSGSIGEEVAVNAMKAGATDYLLKDRLGRLGSAVHNALEQARLRESAKRSEEARHSAEDLFRQLVDNSLVGVVILQDDRYIYANSRVAEIFGYTEEEMRELDSWRRVVAPDEVERMSDQLRRRLNGETPRAQYTFRGVRKDGQLIDVEIHSNRIHLNGKPAALGMMLDITQRVRAEAETLRMTDLLRAIAEWTPDAVFVKDRDGKYLLFNPAASRFVGRPVEEVIGHDDTELFDPESSRIVMERDRYVMTTGIMETKEEELTAFGIKKRVFLATKAPYRDAYGKVIGVIGISRDITEQKEAEAERDLLLSRLQLQIQRMPLGCLITDADFKIIEWNAAAERIFGYTKEEMLGCGPPFEKILVPSRWPIVVKVLDRVRQGDMTAHLVNHNLTKSGRQIICEWNNTPLHDAEGNFIGTISIAQDVTDRREAEAAILLRDRAMQAVTQGIIITDPSLPDNPIVYVSPSFEELTGYTAAEVLGKNCRFLQGPETDPETVARLRRCIRDGQTCKVEILNYRKDGSSFWNELQVSPVVDPVGKLTHFVGSQADVTARRKLEEQLRQVQKMEAIGRLAGGVAHDFNNLLTVINGYSEMILDSVTEDHVKEYVEQIKAAGDRATALTGQLLAFSRKQLLQPVVVDLNAQIRDMQKMLNRLIGEDIELNIYLSPELSRIYADRSQVEQIVLNLILNARDAMPAGGSLTVETKDIELDPQYLTLHTEAHPGRNVLLVVSDTGSGMDRATQARIFEPFFTTKEADKGTGLGLSTVYGIVKQSNGHIEVYSELGVGTTFKVYLPAYQSNGDPIPADEDVPGEMPRGTETLLLVEDEDGVRSLAATILRSNGYNVLQASNGNEALKLLEESTAHIQMILTDVVMPVMGGRELVEQATQIRPEMKILFMSGYTEDSVVRLGVLNSAADFLQKPFTALSLGKKVRETLDAAPH